MVLQSSLGNDLRTDGATISFTSINLYATFFPMAHNTASTLEAMLRNDTNDQSFNDYLSAANMLYPIPANATNIPISIPSRNWAAFRGWSFTRLKTKETPSLGSGFDPYFVYSGSIPYLDGTFTLTTLSRRSPSCLTPQSAGLAMTGCCLQMSLKSSALWMGKDTMWPNAT